MKDILLLLDKTARFINKHRLMTPEVILLAGVFVAAMITGAGFFLGKTCHQLTLPICYCVLFIGALLVSRRSAVVSIGLLVLAVVLTMFTFSYAAADVSAYHLPVQDLLYRGWNPVFDSTVEKFAKLTEGYSLYAHHALFLPHFAAMIGALVAKSVGIFQGDAFLNYILAFALSIVAFRFAKQYFASGIWASALFSAGLVFHIKMNAFLCGQVDYIVYCSLLISLFSICLYIQTDMLGDLIVASAALVFAATSKGTGLLSSGVILILWCVLQIRNKCVLFAAACIIGSILVIGAAPLLTSWIQYGSPVYPSMTFNHSIELIDLTDDFTANDDGLRMGYAARICHSWVSSWAARFCCSACYGQHVFNPEFYVAGGVDGYGQPFRALICVSIIALLFSRKNLMTWLAIFVFALANLSPLKYIGYGRYFMIIWAVPFLSLYNLAYHPIILVRQIPHRIVVAVSVFGLFVLMCFMVARTGAYYGKTLAAEAARQMSFSEIENDGCGAVLFVAQRPSYSVYARLAAIGLRRDASDYMVDNAFNVLYKGKPINVQDAKLPVCNSLFALLEFPWLKAFSHWPRPIIRR